LAEGLAPRLVLITPRAAEDPVVQAFATIAQSLARTVVRAGDVTVH